MTNGGEDKTIEEFFRKQDGKEKRKLIIRTIIISSIVSIILFSMFSYHLYSYIKLNNCLNNNAALYQFQEGNLELVEVYENTEIYKGYGCRVCLTKEGVINVSDENAGYIKVYKNNILQLIYVDNLLADFVSYLNPKVWFGASRTIRSDKKYQIRSDEEINNLNTLIEKGGEKYLSSSNIKYMKIEDQYLVLK